jgi:hypothetical protein
MRSQPIRSPAPVGAMLMNPNKMSEALPSLAPVLKQDRREPAGAGGLLHTLPAAQWHALGDLVRRQQPALSAPRPGAPGLCVVCRGPSRRRSARCYQCDLHLQCAHGELADVVVPVAFAVKGGQHARQLWRYKSPHADAGSAGAAAANLLALLLVFLRDHGACVARAAGQSGRAWPAGPGLADQSAWPAWPTHVAVVPTARRPGLHPLRALIAPYLNCAWADLAAAPGGQQERDLDPARFCAARIPGARVLLLDDTWTSGASAQSAAMSLRRAGASSVAVVVLGRHVSPGDLSPAAAPFLPAVCAAHIGCAVAG